MDLRLAFAILSIMPALASSAGVIQKDRRRAEEPRRGDVPGVASILPSRSVFFAPLPKLAPSRGFQRKREATIAFAFATVGSESSMRDLDERLSAEGFLASRRGFPRRVPRWASPYTRKKWYFAVNEAPAESGGFGTDSATRIARNSAPPFDVSVGVAGASLAGGAAFGFVRGVREAP